MRRKRPRVTFGDDTAPTWQRGIRESRVFFCLLSPSYLRSPRLWEHVAYARSLGKPVRVAVIKGAEVPEGFFAGIDDLEIRVCQTPDEVEAFVRESLR